MRESPFAIALVTVPTLKVGRQLVGAILQARLAACVNIIARVESHYWWQGKLERSAECLLLIKTKRAKLAALEQCVLDNHPYDTPEFLVVDITAGNPKYLQWLAESTVGRKGR